MSELKVGDTVQIIAGALAGEKGEVLDRSYDFGEDWVYIHLEPRNVNWWAQTSTVKLVPNKDLLTVQQKRELND